ncbi:MAG TPA: type I secretion system permease/ATPase [Xanthobacteraceae bacterium]|nr:type I secretion system permease/ATPase [Xanthobacteraceae bacterium]
MRSASPAPHPAIAAAFGDCRRAFVSVAAFSGLVNILMLAGPLYMLQIYDRVLASHSVPTLVALTVLLVGAFALQALLDGVRGRIVVRTAGTLDQHLGTAVHRAVILAGAAGRGADAQQPVRDLDQLRGFLTSPGPLAILDLPWMIVFLAMCFLIHVWLGLLATFGALLLVAVTLLTERASRLPARRLQQGAAARAGAIEGTRRNSETILAMGLGPAVTARWRALNERYLAGMERSTDVINGFGTASRTLRLFLQSAMLGTGAYLVIRQELSAGAMIAASIMMGRALAPVEAAIANWRGFVAARDSLHRLSAALARLGSEPERTALPAPQSGFTVEQLAVAAPGSRRLIVNNINLRLQAGEALGIVGPSGSGKTSLVRTLVGAWPPARGEIRIDGATLDQWVPEQLGARIGYVAQTVELFDATVTDNIARMQDKPDAAAVVAAAKAAGAHEMILRLPDGYNTRVGDGGAALSAGQRQRIALARALYGDPFLIVLDEPNANLDAEGEAALFQAIRAAKARRAIVILIAHRIAALSVCDKLLVLRDGAQQAFGPRDEVMRYLRSGGRPVPALGGLTVVGAE